MPQGFFNPRPYGTRYYKHMVKGNSFNTIRLTHNAIFELKHKFKREGGPFYCVLTLNEKYTTEEQEWYTVEFMSKCPSIRLITIEVAKHSDPYVITVDEETYKKLKFTTLDCKITYDCLLLGPKYKSRF